MATMIVMDGMIQEPNKLTNAIVNGRRGQTQHHSRFRLMLRMIMVQDPSAASTETLKLMFDLDTIRERSLCCLLMRERWRFG